MEKTDPIGRQSRQGVRHILGGTAVWEIGLLHVDRRGAGSQDQAAAASTEPVGRFDGHRTAQGPAVEYDFFKTEMIDEVRHIACNRANVHVVKIHAGPTASAVVDQYDPIPRADQRGHYVIPRAAAHPPTVNQDQGG